MEWDGMGRDGDEMEVEVSEHCDRRVKFPFLYTLYQQYSHNSE